MKIKLIKKIFNIETLIKFISWFFTINILIFIIYFLNDRNNEIKKKTNGIFEKEIIISNNTQRINQLDNYHLTINGSEWRKFIKYVDEIRLLDFLPSEQFKWFKAMLYFKGENYKVKIRVRGDFHTHWRGSKRSYRIKFVDKLFDGKEEINLIVPWDKDYGIELLQTEISKSIGMLYFPGKFVNLSLNGQNFGSYYESEQPTYQMLERLGYPASSIFTFNSNWTSFRLKSGAYLDYDRDGRYIKKINQDYVHIKHRNTFDKKNIISAKSQLSRVIYLVNIIDKSNIEEARKIIPQLINLDNFAKYIALQYFFGSYHATNLGDNTRLYFNPTNGLFEFIPWDMALMSIDKKYINGSIKNLDDEYLSDAFKFILDVSPKLFQKRNDFLIQMIKNRDKYSNRLKSIHSNLRELYPQEKLLFEKSIKLEKIFEENMKTLSSLFEFQTILN